MADVTIQRPGPQLQEPRSWRRAKNRIATVLMVLSFVLVIIPLGFVLVTVVAKGASVISRSFLTSSIPVSVAPANEGGIGPAVVGTLEITALATVMAVPLGILGRDLPQRVRRQGHPGAAHRVHVRRDDGRAVDHHGAVHLLDLGAALRLLRPGRRLRPGLPDAADRDPLHLRDAEARAECAPRRRLRPRSHQGPGDDDRCPPGRDSGESSAARCWRSPAPPGRRRRCCSPFLAD